MLQNKIVYVYTQFLSSLDPTLESISCWFRLALRKSQANELESETSNKDLIIVKTPVLSQDNWDPIMITIF